MRVKRLGLIATSLLATAIAQAPQQTASVPAAAKPAEAAASFPADLPEIVKKQFGSCFEIARQRTVSPVPYLRGQVGPAWVPFVAGDLDGDGIEDAVVVAHCREPLKDQVDYQYTVIDPFSTAWGYGNPKITSHFNSGDPEHNLLLVIHGAGREAWRAALPKRKFVVINLPFDTIFFTHIMFRKKPIAAVGLEEGDPADSDSWATSSAIFWDGKKYRWQDTAARK